MTLIKNYGLKTDLFYLPPFELKANEIVVINIFDGGLFYDTEMFLKDIFTGKTQNENVTVFEPLSFVEHIIEPKLRRLLYPITVDKYLRKKASPKSNFYSKIYEIPFITKKTKINSLAGTYRRLLSLYTQLSVTNKIVLDLVGADPMGAEKIYDLIKESANNGGGCILIDNYDDMKNDCNTYIELEWDWEKIQPIKPREFKLKA